MRAIWMRSLSGVLALYSLVGTAAQAPSVIYQCNACTQAQMQSEAIGLGVGNHLVGNFPNGVLNGYTVTREPDGRGGYTYFVDGLTPTAAQQQAFDNYKTLIIQFHAAAIIVLVPNHRPSGYPTSFDTHSGLDWASMQSYTNGMNTWLTNVQAHIQDNSIWLPGSAVTALFAAQSGIAVDGYAPTVQFVIQLNDLSTVTLTWNNGVATLTKVTDQYNNTIPIRNFNGSTNFNGSYSVPYSGGPYGNNLLNYLNSLGAKIVFPTNSPIMIVCVSGQCTQQN